MVELNFGLTEEELDNLRNSSQTARITCEGGGEGDMG